MSSGRVPWQFSQALGGEYLYFPSRDEILLRDGRRIQRPQGMSRAGLAAATVVEGSGTDADTFSSGGPGSYSTSSGPGIQQGPASVPRYSTYASPATSPPASSDLISQFNNMSVSGPSNRPSASNQPQIPAQSQQGQQRVAFARDPVRGGYVANVVTQVRAVPGSRNTEVTASDVVGSGGDTETLFPQYKQRNKRFFFVGKVFSMLWSEPAGIPHATQITTLEEGISIGKFGERVYSKIRRFVVIRTGDTYCNALPISTYNGRGVGKRGVTKSEHCIIYTGSAPSMMEIEMARRGEMPMRNTPIRVDPDNREDILDPRSRLNFGHPHTIQHNIKAKSCGKVPQEHIDAMILQFAQVFGIVSPSNRRRRDHGSAEGESGHASGTAAPDDDDDDDDGDDDDGDDDDEQGDNNEGADDDSDDEDDQNVRQLRNAMNTMLRNGANAEDVLRTTLSSLVQRGLDRRDASNLIKKAYKPSK